MLLSKSHSLILMTVLIALRSEAIAAGQEPLPPSRSSLPPDILFIAVDDLNDWTGHLAGHPQARTPNIDRLVSRGVVFTNAHCAAPACNPSRAALMSGLRPWQTGIYTNGDPAGPVLANVQTLNRHFMTNGYQVRGGGKIYHNLNAEGRKDSWHQWVGLFPGSGDRELNLNGLNKSHFDWGPIEARNEQMSDHRLTSWAIEQLQNAPLNQPMFLAVGYTKPHLPWYVPKEYFDRFPLEQIELPIVTADDLADVPPAGVAMANPKGDHAAVVQSNQWKQAVQGYLATISFLDDEIGRLLNALESSSRANNTVVVWWTDHGWHLGEKEHWRKFSLWERATRTSFAIAAPKLTQPKTRCHEPVDYLSVYPTLCQVAGIPVPEHIQGVSLVPLLNSPDSSLGTVALCTHGRGNHAVRDAQFRYIRYANGQEELYDHRNDPHEWHNLASENKYFEVKARLARHLPAIDDESPATNLSKSAVR